MQLVINPAGIVQCVYDEAIDLSVLGQPVISRGSHVEPNAAGNWYADLSPVGGPMLGPYILRSEALEAERAWLEKHWLGSSANNTLPILTQ
ncbi:MAG: hypothetical protein ACYC4U_31310 [Pirellulaceae bacterium]